MIGGLSYVPDYLNQHEHDQFIEVVDQFSWRRSLDHDVQVYGYSYNHRQGVAVHLGALPRWAELLAARLQDDRYFPQRPNQLVVNSYQPGDGFWDHIDHALFGDVVVSISLGSTCVMRFTREDTDASEELMLEPRSLLVLSGESRWQWRHGIPVRAVDRWGGLEHARSRRVSLTFRLIQGDGADTDDRKASSQELNEA